MENTIKNQKAFTAQYYGQDVLINSFCTGYSPIKVYEDALNYIGHKEMYTYLLLTPISLISDEDAEYCIGKEECRLRINNPNHGDYGMTPSGIFVNSIIGGDTHYICKRNIDFLRSRGYALPWMGLSVEEQVKRGWVVLKTK